MAGNGMNGRTTNRRRLILAPATLLILAAFLLAAMLAEGAAPGGATLLRRLIVVGMCAGAVVSAWVLVSAFVRPAAAAGVKADTRGAEARNADAYGANARNAGASSRTAPGNGGDARQAAAGPVGPVERLAGGIAHDLNNILLVLRGYTDLALAEKDVSPQVLRHLQELTVGLERGADLASRLFIVARRYSAPLAPLDLNEAVQGALWSGVKAASDAERVRFTPRPGLPPVRAAAELVERLVTSLRSYALQSMPEAGVLGVSTDVEEPDDGKGRRVVLRLDCPGILISESDEQMFFEPFSASPSSGKRLGLGPAVARGAAALLDGEISIRASASGGVSFRVELPAIDGAAVAEASTSRNGAMILIAEDDRSIRELAERVLRREGYSVLTAADGEEAVRLFEANRDSVRLALLDDVMPRMGGRAVAETIRRSKPALPVILCTGYAWSVGDPAADAATAEELLSKPWEPREMLHRVRRLLS